MCFRTLWRQSGQNAVQAPDLAFYGLDFGEGGGMPVKAIGYRAPEHRRRVHGLPCLRLGIGAVEASAGAFGEAGGFLGVLPGAGFMPIGGGAVGGRFLQAPTPLSVIGIQAPRLSPFCRALGLPHPAQSALLGRRLCHRRQSSIMSIR